MREPPGQPGHDESGPRIPPAAESQAAAKAKAKVFFVYPNGYGGSEGSAGGQSFSRPPASGAIVYGGRYSVAIVKVWEGTLSAWDDRLTVGLGGWSLSPHHVYDPTSGTLFTGSGERRSVATLGNVARIIPATRGTFVGGQPINTRFALGHPGIMPDGRLVLPYRIEGTGNSAPGIIRILGTDGAFVDSIPNGGRPSGVAGLPSRSNRGAVRTPGNRFR